MVINTTAISGLSSFQGIAYYTNNMVDGLLFTGGLSILFFVILFGVLKSGELFEHALAIASWSIFIVSLFFWFGELVPMFFPLLFLLLAATSTFYIYASR